VRVVREHAFVDIDGSIRHALDGEVLRARQCVLAHAVSQRWICQQASHCIAKRDRIRDIREKAGFAVFDDFRDSAGSRRSDWDSERQRVEEHGSHALFTRAQGRHIRCREQRVGIGTIAGDMKHSLKTKPPHFFLDIAPKRTVAGEKRVGARNAVMQAGDRADEVEWILVPNQLRHLDDQRCIDRNAERKEGVSRRRCYRSLCVDTIGHDMNPGRRNSASLEHTRDGIRDRDDRVGTAVFPARAGIRSQREIDASRDDEPDRCPNRRERANGDRVGRVRVNDIDLVFSNVAAQTQCGARVGLEGRTAIDNADALLFRPQFEWLAAPSRYDRNVPTTRECASEPERLSLTAPPSPLRIDMQYAIAHGAQLPWSGHPTQGSLATPSPVTRK